VTRRLRLLCWEGYDSRAILDPFAERHGADVAAETLLSDAAAAAGLVAGDIRRFDVLNINNAYVRDYLYPRGLIATLDESRFAELVRAPAGAFERHVAWTRSLDGNLIGICQRFGPFNMVVNTRRIDLGTAEDQGFALAADPLCRQRYAILEYEDFNLFHLCIAAGINPFTPLDAGQEEAVVDLARRWYAGAAMASADHHRLNKALIDGEIDFYLSGGVYTVSPARLEGHVHLRAVTPRRGPIDGKGGIAFTEITSVLDRPQRSPLAEPFLAYLLEPETAVRAAFAQGTCNPVVQMHDPRIFGAFSKPELLAIQWDTLLEDMSCCADYQLMPNHDRLLTRIRSMRLG